MKFMAEMEMDMEEQINNAMGKKIEKGRCNVCLAGCICTGVKHVRVIIRNKVYLMQNMV